MEDIRRQELHCHNCDRYVQFDLDVSLNGNHVLKCPNCNHEHCRVVKDGVITDRRWDSRNGGFLANGYATFSINTNTTSSSTISTWDSSGDGTTSGTTNAFTLDMWTDLA